MPGILSRGTPLLRIIVLGAYIVSFGIACLGTVLVYLGASGSTSFTFFGQSFDSTNAGIGAIFIGGATAVLLIRRALKSVDHMVATENAEPEGPYSPVSPLGRIRNGPVSFAQVAMETGHCLWEEVWQEGDDNKKRRYAIGFHQLPTFSWASEKRDSDPRIADPIFDLTLINHGSDSLLLSHVGFEALSCWSTTKGLPVAGKVKTVDAYEIVVKSFTPGNVYLEKLDDPVYMAPGAPYRFQLRLRDFRQAVRGNESALRLVIRADGTRVASPDVYMGLF